MRTIKAEPITYESYAPFGTFYNMTEPSGYSRHSFAATYVRL